MPKKATKAKAKTSTKASAEPKMSEKAPIQLCPVPGCKNRAAPVFGMVCSDHQNVSLKKIYKYRETRREEKKAAKKRARKKSK